MNQIAMNIKENWKDYAVNYSCQKTWLWETRKLKSLETCITECDLLFYWE